ncbi:MAG TPA: type II toxin-antitoxin system Phd/YefM family antitoxin [Oscillospiraceae bacterium]|nr:type II toxin-antitoxin system Phd/YefM family antitoxin [Oscillospiraceae bacterium]
MGIRIKNITEVRRRLFELMNTLHNGPLFIAKKGRVSAVLMDLADYHSLLGELEDLTGLIHTMGEGDCGCAEDDTVQRLLALDEFAVND